MEKIVKHLKNRKVQGSLLVLALVVVGVSYLVFSKAATPGSVNVTAGAANFSLNPATGSYGTNKSFSVAIYENSGSEPVGAVDVKLSYDQTKLDFVSVDTNGGVYTNCFENTGGNGSVSLVCSKLGSSFTGNQKIGNVTFKTKSASGTAAVSFKNTSHIYKADGIPTEIWSGNTNGGTYTIGTSSGGGGTTTPPPTTTTPPTSSGGSSSPSGGTSSPSSGSTSSGSGGSGSTSSGSGSSSATVPSTQPVTGSSQGSKNESITIKITDELGEAIAGATVTLKDVEATSDSNGLVRYYNVTPGSYTVSVKTDKGEVIKKITVKDTNGKTTAQQFTVEVKPKSPILTYVIYGVIGVITIVAVYALIVMLSRYQKNLRFRRTHGLDSKKAVVFDSNSSPLTTPDVAQGPMVTFDTKPAAPTPKAPSPAPAPAPTPAKPPTSSVTTSEPTPGNVIAPEPDATPKNPPATK